MPSEDEKLYFETLKELRDWYIVEYRPPGSGMPFATLNITCLQATPFEDVAAAMEQELSRWLERYPFPLMVSAFDDCGDLINLGSVRPISHVVGFRNPHTDALSAEWRLVKDDEFPHPAPTNEYLRSAFADIPHKTSEQLRALKLLGKLEPSDAEQAKVEEDLRIQHHHYHGEENPEGFRRLKHENFERWEREEIRAEAETLRSSQAGKRNEG